MQTTWIASIAGRLRIVLLTVVLLVLSQTVIVYFTTGQIIERQNEVSDDLIETEYRKTRLIKELDRIAAQGRSLQFIDNPEDIQNTVEALTSDIDSVRTEFARAIPEGDRLATSINLDESLAIYKSLIVSAADDQMSRIVVEGRLKTQLQDVKRLLAEMLDTLASEIVERKIALDQSIVSLEFNADPENVAVVRRTYNDLIALNSIADAVDSQRLFLPSFELDIGLLQPKKLRERARLQAKSLAIQLAKLPTGNTQSALAALAIDIAKITFGTDGISDQIETLQSVESNYFLLVEEKQLLTSKLIELTQSLTNAAQEGLVAARSSSDTLVQRTRTSLLVTTAIAGSLIFAALFLVIERQFLHRIRLLTNRMLAIAAGRADPSSAFGGGDELRAMSDALEVFKANASELRNANTALEQRNEEVRQLGSRLETILDTTTSGIVAFDQQGRIILANLPARHILGGISEEVPFDRPKEVKFLDREDLSPLDASSDPINRTLAGQVLDQEIALMQRAGVGDGRYVRLTSGKLNDANSVVKTVLVIDDVSVAEQNRQQVERSSRLDALGQLTGGIAHDFNNLLATIQYTVQLVADSEEAQEREEYSQMAMESVERGAQLSSRLLTFAKRQPGVSQSIGVETLLEDFKGLVEPTIKKAISIEFRIDDPDMSVFCDSAQLENALLNLVINARDAILSEESGGKITIAVRGVSELKATSADRVDDPSRYPNMMLEAELGALGEGHSDLTYRYVEFSISDDGPGMTPDVKRRALDPFFTTKSTNSGTGLGLSMVYGFVQQSGGELYIYSEVGSGTTMRLLLPRGSVNDTREEPVLRELPVPGNGQRILIAEDEPHLRRAMNDLVTGLGYQVSTATCGGTALEMIESSSDFDLLLTDIVMPGGIGGFELAAKVRSIRPKLPILYMSGYAAYSEKEMGVVIAPLLQKPCSPRALAEHLHNALSARNPSSSTAAPKETSATEELLSSV